VIFCSASPTTHSRWYVQRMGSTEVATFSVLSLENEKTEYDLRRDERVAQLATTFRLVEVAAREL
jgi:hypothetical protein